MLAKRSRTFRLISSLSLSSAYYALALGVSLRTEGSLLISADQPIATTATQVTDGLALNLAVATLLSILTTYLFLRRGPNDSPDESLRTYFSGH